MSDPVVAGNSSGSALTQSSTGDGREAAEFASEWNDWLSVQKVDLGDSRAFNVTTVTKLVGRSDGIRSRAVDSVGEAGLECGSKSLELRANRPGGLHEHRAD